MSEHCGFGALCGELVRDCIIVVLRDKRLLETLQFDKDLTLENPIQIVKLSEQVHQRRAVHQESTLTLSTENDAIRLDNISSTLSLHIFPKMQETLLAKTKCNGKAASCVDIYLAMTDSSAQNVMPIDTNVANRDPFKKVYRSAQAVCAVNTP